MWSNPQENADLVTFTEKILNGKLHCFCSDFQALRNGLKNFRPRLPYYFEWTRRVNQRN